ncbi:MAG: YaiI/YqxD family protein [Treponemataceae bacterium]
MPQKSNFSIWIDADSCPTPIKDLIIRFAKRLSIPCIFVANRNIPFEKNKLFSMVICDDAANAADLYIVDNADKNDIVITRDIPFAALLVEKGIVTLNDRGTIFDQRNIQEKLSMRNLNMQLVESGIAFSKTSQLGKKECNKFANAFDRVLTKKIAELKVQENTN